MLNVLRTVRAILPLALAGLSILFLIDYGRSIYPLWKARRAEHEPADFGLLTRPHFYVYRAICHAHGERDGWSLNWVYDGAEGTRCIIYFPSWPLVIVAFGGLMYAGVAIYDLSGRRRGEK